MRLYLVTADQATAEPLLAAGLFAGITTNPTILQRAGKGPADIPDICRWATAAGASEVFLQSWVADHDSLVARAEQLLSVGDRAVLKFVPTRSGFAAAGPSWLKVRAV